MTTNTQTSNTHGIVNDELTVIEAMSREQYDQARAAAQANVQACFDSWTQREWIQIRGALDATRDQIIGDVGLTLAACAWVQAKRQHGGADWGQFLAMTDGDLMRLHGYPDPAQVADGQPD